MNCERDSLSTCARILLSTACLLAAACSSTPAGNRTAAPATGLPAPSGSKVAVPLPDAPPVPESPAEKTYSNRIKWKTASEVDNYGYAVYRAESPDGPFEQINPEVIEGAGTTDEHTDYEYLDRAVDPYKTYYYYVESISMNGVRTRFTPVAKTEPKIADGGEGHASRPAGGTRPEL